MDGQDEGQGEPNYNEEAAPAEESNKDQPPQGSGAGGDSNENVASGGAGDREGSEAGSGGLSLRPVFLGNLTIGYKTEDVAEIFNKPIVPRDVPEGTYNPIPVDRVDLKRGYCFVFLKDAVGTTEKEQVDRFVSDINGMAVTNVSSALRAEFARGDGKVKRKEEERRKDIRPSETLFVVNFNEETTKKDDLELLFGPFGELVRIDMKGNYAFVQFRSVDEAIRAKEATNGGKLDTNVLTVEFVARQRGENRRRGRGGFRGGGRDRRYDDRRGPPPRGPPPPSRYPGYDRRYDSRRDDRYDEPRYGRRSRSPPGGYRRRSRSRSYSPPPRYRSRSPPRRYDDRGRYDDYPPPRRGPSPPPRRGPSPPSRRGSSPPPPYRDPAGDRDFYRGYRP